MREFRGLGDILYRTLHSIPLIRQLQHTEMLIYCTALKIYHARQPFYYYAATEVQCSFVMRFLIQAYQSLRPKTKQS